MPSFRCKDIGMKCDFETKAPTEAELLANIRVHAKSVHKLDPVPKETLEKIRKAIKK